MKALALFFSSISLGLITVALAQNRSQELGAIIGSKVCMTDLGCFEITKDFFHLRYRPINFLPIDRKEIDTQFHLYTKKRPMEFINLKYNDKDTMKELDITHRTVFLAHGFFESKYYGKWMEKLKDNILLNNDFNVIMVEWSKGNRPPYLKACANARVVGAELALVIESLIKNIKLDPMKVHIVGHSLGAHIAGYAGERLKKLGRITGLDPAGPFFQYMPPSVRLDPTDAEFVDNIHTDSSSVLLLALGMQQAVGHVDFYPNNGMKQPGCKNAPVHSLFLDGLLEATRRFMTCNHQRSVDFFVHTINYRRALPVAFKCDSWLEFTNGQCADCSRNRCLVMGMDAEQYKPYKDNAKPVKMYLATSAKAPFWEFSFQITMKLFKPKSGSQDRKGTLNLNMAGSESTYDIKLAVSNLAGGATYTYLVRQEEPLGTIKSLTFTWTSSTLSLFSKKVLHLDYIIVKPMNAANETEQNRQTQKFCNKGQKPLNSKAAVKLTTC